MSEPTVAYTVREMFDKIEGRLDDLEKSAAKQETVRSVRRAAWLAVALSPVSGSGAALFTWLLTRH